MLRVVPSRIGRAALWLALCAATAACQTAASPHLSPVALGLESDGACVYRPILIDDGAAAVLARQRFCGDRPVAAR